MIEGWVEEDNATARFGVAVRAESIWHAIDTIKAYYTDADNST